MNPDEAKNESSSHQAPPKMTKKAIFQEVLEWAKVIAIAIAIAIPVRYFIAEPFIVNGPSMDPTFSSGQFLMVDRVSYRFHAPKRGDVVVFKYPYNENIYYIKRIIGLPGERVIIENGKVSIDTASGTQKIILNEPYVKPYHYSKESVILPAGGGYLKDREYVVLGDNRAESSDSRSWGILNMTNVVGRPFIRLMPLQAIAIYPGQYHEETNKK